jgi:DNA-binding SARP family transcriptional activator
MLADHRRSCHRITVLGSFAVIPSTGISSTGAEPGEAVPLGVDARRVVAYLAVHRRPQRRAQLSADLWPGALLDEASFDEALTAAAELLEERADGMLALDPAADVDLDEAMALVRTLAHAPGRPDGVPADLPRVRALLGADILPGDPAPWLAVERERFRQIRLNAMEELSAALSAAGRHTDAVAVADDAVRTAPSRESARRALIEAHLAQGEIAEAVAQYDEYQELLRSSVGAPLGSGMDGVFGLEGLLPPVPAWPVLRVRRSMQRVGMAPPVFRTARGGSRRLVAGGTVPGTTR